MRVGYLPDMFGHVAQMPQILRRAGIDGPSSGAACRSSIDRHRFVWLAPDGSAVETEYLVGGYGNGAYLFDVPDRRGVKLDGYRDGSTRLLRRPVAAGDVRHRPRRPVTASGRPRGAGQRGARPTSRCGSRPWPTTSSATIARPGAGRRAAVWTGELRSGARANMLMNVISARVDLKRAPPTRRAAARALRRAARRAPWRRPGRPASWSSPGGGWSRTRPTTRSAAARTTQVVAQVMARYRGGRADRRGHRRPRPRAWPARRRRAAGPSSTRRRSSAPTSSSSTSPSPPTGRRWRSGPATGGSRPRRSARPATAIGAHRVRGAAVAEFFDRRRHGRELFGRQINGLTIDARRDPPWTLDPSADDVADPPELDVERAARRGSRRPRRSGPTPCGRSCPCVSDRRRLLARVPAPPLGHVWVGEADAGGRDARGGRASGRRRRRGGSRTASSRSRSRTTARSSCAAAARAQRGGSDRRRRRRRRQLQLRSPGDDLLVDAPLERRRRRRDRGPLRGELVIIRTYDWPRGLTPDAGGPQRDDGAHRPSGRTWSCAPRSRSCGSGRLREPGARPSGPVPHPGAGTGPGSAAEGQFAVVERGLTIEGGHGEVPLPTFPAHGFVSVEGVSVLLEQVTEYEVVEGRELALTLLRSFGLISRNANPYREDPAGPEIPVPAAQLLGERASSFAILPHRGGWLGAGHRGLGGALPPPGAGRPWRRPGRQPGGRWLLGQWLPRRPAGGWCDLDRPASTRGLARAAGRSPPAGRRPGPHPAPARERPGARGAGRRPARASRGSRSR